MWQWLCGSWDYVVWIWSAWTCFFDDYTLLSQEASSASASFAAESLFKLLGVQYAPEGSKNTELSKLVKTLVVFLNLDGENGSVELGHTDSRKQELSETLDAILSEVDQNCGGPSRQTSVVRNFCFWKNGKFLSAQVGRDFYV